VRQDAAPAATTVAVRRGGRRQPGVPHPRLRGSLGQRRPVRRAV